LRGRKERHPGLGSARSGVAAVARAARAPRFEYYRHGTLSLYASLNTRNGEVGRHRGRITLALLLVAGFIRDLAPVLSQSRRGERRRDRARSLLLLSYPDRARQIVHRGTDRRQQIDPGRSREMAEALYVATGDRLRKGDWERAADSKMEAEKIDAGKSLDI
jgi:hypothetical protein